MNIDFDGSKKGEAGVSVTSRKGKLEAFQKYFGRGSEESDLDFEWKEVFERKVSMCSSLSEACEDEVIEE